MEHWIFSDMLRGLLENVAIAQLTTKIKQIHTMPGVRIISHCTSVQHAYSRAQTLADAFYLTPFSGDANEACVLIDGAILTW